MKLRTEWALEPGGKPIDHESRILLVGSCFSEHIAQKLRIAGFHVLENPHGILFQPLALEKCISDCLSRRLYEPQDLQFTGKVWASLNHHGRFNDTEPERVLNAINASIEKGHDYLQTATHLVLTLGTSWVYRHLERDQRVANCHKIPQKEFSKELLSVAEIQKSLETIVSGVREANPSIAILLTVSPVRHIRDGVIENSRSKARLIEAVHELVSQEEGTHYFPSYELMMDDLRDYRFYASDLVHPNEMAVEYIWEKFKEAWIDPQTIPVMKKAESIHKAMGHKPVEADSEAHKAFQESIEKRIIELQALHPNLSIYRS